MKKQVLFLAIGLLTGPIAIAATYYMPDDCANLHECFGVMQGGDTLIIRDGVYPNTTDNSIQPWNIPPIGNANHYTRVVAEHDGRVIFDRRDDQNGMFRLSGNGDVYFIFQGIIWQQPIDIYRTNFVKMIKCGVGYDIVNSAASLFGIASSESILLEDCYAWGGGRYKFLAYESNKIVFRRCVGRSGAIDTNHGGRLEPIGMFAFYRTSNSNAQNCVAIDSKNGDYWTYTSLAGAFSNPNNAAVGVNDRFDGCIGLNLDMSVGNIGHAYSNTFRKNIIAWNISKGVVERGESVFSHCTIGDIEDNAINGDGIVEIRDTLFYDIRDNVFARWGGMITTDYNLLYESGNNYANGIVAGDHDLCEENSNAIDPIDGSPGNGIPALKYLPRIEDGSDLDGAASDGGDIGATVLYKIGRSGTLWGEEGYNETTDEPLWPFPNEDLIKEKMSAYTYDQDGDGNPEITGKRGFCADGAGLYGGRITLTSYIWEYLGNPCPVDVCNYYDVNRDGHVNVQDIQIVANHILGIATSENADTTGDGSVTIQDVQGVVNVILAGTQG